ncbi:MAG: LutB/LldF family L-lactate oxidation iron-sulfur protein [Acidimicrobiales bacterium]
MNNPHKLASTTLRERTAVALDDPTLRPKLRRALGHFDEGRKAALRHIENPLELRQAARAMRTEIMARLPEILQRLADNVIAQGGNVHWAVDAEDANAYIAEVAKRKGAKLVAKSKSMATEETGLNEALSAIGAEPIETDLGEWLVQLDHKAPSHIIAPAVHMDRHEVKQLMKRTQGASDDLGTTPPELVAFARQRLREQFLAADIGITGCNLAVADTGSIILVMNEGNGRMVTALPKVHIALMGMERVVENWDQADLILNLLARSASGQDLSSYTNIITGPGDQAESDGAEEFHLVIMDNGRSDILGSKYEEMLNCIRCGACLNVCPVYRQVGGHAYGWVYSGPMGAVLTPLLQSEEPHSAELANASTLCGACMEACPVEIPLQDLLLALRQDKALEASRSEKLAWKAWSMAWSKQRSYEASMKASNIGSKVAGDGTRLPGLRRWAQGRALLQPAKRSFRQRWADGDV